MRESIELAKRLLVDSIWKSARLEGLGTTLPKTEAILNNIPTNTSSEEVYFILNMKRAWNFLLDTIGEYPVNIMYLRELNRLCMENLIYDNGEIRKGIVTIGGTNWVPEIPNSAVIIEELEKIKRGSYPEVLRALKYFCYIARTQMFTDGNKRLAQLIANKVLIEGNIGIFQIPVEFDEDFKELLIEFYETNNDENIIGFMQDYCIVDLVKGKKRIEVESKKIVIPEQEEDVLKKMLKPLYNTGIPNGRYLLCESNNIVSFSKLGNQEKTLLKVKQSSGEIIINSLPQDVLTGVLVSLLNIKKFLKYKIASITINIGYSNINESSYKKERGVSGIYDLVLF